MDSKDSKYKLEEIELNLPRKKIVYMKVDDLEDYKIKNTEDEYKLSISGNYEEFKAIKKTKKFKELEKSGVKIVFKASKIETKLNAELRNELKTELDKGNEYNNELNENNFEDILKVLISKEYNEDLNKDYELVIHNRVVNDDIMFI